MPAVMPEPRVRTPLPLDQLASHCTLCGQQRKKLIQGMHGGVCLDCVVLCNEIIRQSDEAQAQQAGERLQKRLRDEPE